jgi:hypothetical protein
MHKLVNTGGVGTFAKEKKLELMWINLVKKRRQNRSLEVNGLCAAQRPDIGW